MRKKRHESSQPEAFLHLVSRQVFPAAIIRHAFGASQLDFGYLVRLDAGCRKKGVRSIPNQPDFCFRSRPKELDHFQRTHQEIILRKTSDVKKPHRPLGGSPESRVRLRQLPGGVVVPGFCFDDESAGLGMGCQPVCFVNNPHRPMDRIRRRAWNPIA